MRIKVKHNEERKYMIIMLFIISILLGIAIGQGFALNRFKAETQWKDKYIRALEGTKLRLNSELTDLEQKLNSMIEEDYKSGR